MSRANMDPTIIVAYPHLKEVTSVVSRMFGACWMKVEVKDNHIKTTDYGRMLYKTRAAQYRRYNDVTVDARSIDDHWIESINSADVRRYFYCWLTVDGEYIAEAVIINYDIIRMMNRRGEYDHVNNPDGGLFRVFDLNAIEGYGGLQYKYTRK